MASVREASRTVGGFDERYVASEEGWLSGALHRKALLAMPREPVVTSGPSRGEGPAPSDAVSRRTFDAGRSFSWRCPAARAGVVWLSRVPGSRAYAGAPGVPSSRAPEVRCRNSAGTARPAST